MNPNVYDKIIKDSGKIQLKEFSQKKKQKK